MRWHTSTLAGLSVLLTGDFERSLSKFNAPITEARLPGRRVYFIKDPHLFAEVSTKRHRSFRDRQDESASCPGVVGATGVDWERRRRALSFIQSRETLQAVVAPAVAQAVGALPADVYSLPPAPLLEEVNALVRRVLHDVAFSAQPPASARPRRPPRAPALLRAVLRRAVRLSLLGEHAAALARRAPFFEVANLFSSKQRKVERRTSRWIAKLSLRRRRRADASADADAAEVAWAETQVRRRWEDARSRDAETSGADDGPGSTGAADLVGALVAADSGLSLSEALDVVKDVMTAGYETTASTLWTAALLLGERPDVAERVAAEARAAQLTMPRRSADGGSGEAQYSSVPSVADRHVAFSAAMAAPTSLAYTRACVLETARLYPAAPLLLRVAREPSSIGDVRVAAGSGIVSSPVCLGRDPEVWAEPDEFRPERFLRGEGSDDGGGGESSRGFVPFGSGPRYCVGRPLAVAISTLAIAAMFAEAGPESSLQSDE